MASLVKRKESKKYYVQWRVGKKLKRRSLETTSPQIAKEKLRQFESAFYRGEIIRFLQKHRLRIFLAGMLNISAMLRQKRVLSRVLL
jgi:hypothetical protein